MPKNKALLHKTASGRYNFSLYAANGKMLAFSNQGYEKKSEAQRILQTYFPNFETSEMSVKVEEAVSKLHKQLAKGRK